jgi:SNF2 family DNA or RNA helicase
LELYQQTNARLWRQGQTADTVVVQHIVTKGTIDERIAEGAIQKGQHTGSADRRGESRPANLRQSTTIRANPRKQKYRRYRL